MALVSQPAECPAPARARGPRLVRSVCVAIVLLAPAHLIAGLGGCNPMPNAPNETQPEQSETGKPRASEARDALLEMFNNFKLPQ
jgi:hypothetical protein